MTWLSFKFKPEGCFYFYPLWHPRQYFTGDAFRFA